MSKKPVEYKTVEAKCACCDSCRIYVEGPMKGYCLYSGPFPGYYSDVEGRSFTLDELRKNLSKKTE